jgi:hypothetical protein
MGDTLLPQISPKQPSRLKKVSTEAPIVFGTAGSGKTRRILETLRYEWGVYLVAPGVDTSRNDSSIFRPVHGGASRDTQSLWNDMHQLQTMHGSSFFQRKLVHLLNSLLMTRVELLNLFREHRKGLGYTTWTRLQINCSQGCDMFDACWRLYRLVFSGIPVKDLSNLPEYSRILWCIDEAQTMLDTQMGQNFFSAMWRPGILRCIVSGTSLQLSEVRRLANKWSYWAVSRHKINVIRPVCLVDFDPSMIDSVELFEGLFMEHVHGIIDESAGQTARPLMVRAGRSLDFEINLSLQSKTALKAIVRCITLREFAPTSLMGELHRTLKEECRSFFGRYRWSTLFIEQVLKEILQRIANENDLPLILENATVPDQQGESLVKDAAMNARNAVRKALLDQLRRIKKESWIESLYKLAIWADVFNQSSIVTEQTARSVSQGFAHIKDLRYGEIRHDQVPPMNQNDPAKVDPDDADVSIEAVQVWMCEPLAVDAVMLHLRKTTDEYDKIMNEFLASSSQLDNGTQAILGKIAEFNLATVRHGIGFHHDVVR